MEEYLRVGVISSTHGIRGEVKIYPTTDDLNRFKKLKSCYLDTGKAMMPLTVTQCKFFKGMAILKFKEFETIESVMPYKGKDILVSRDQAVKLAPNEYFICDLVGLHVFSDEGRELGILEDVLQTGANDVYLVKMADGKELMLPVIKDCILDVNIEEGRVLAHVMPGLMDL